MKPIKVVILAFGSTGDVIPYAALAAGLQADGFEVRVVTHTRFEAMLTARGLYGGSLDVDSKEILETGAGHAWLASGTNPLKFGRRLSAILQPLLHHFAVRCLEECQEADVIISSGLAVLVAAHVAEKLQVPFIPAYLQPVTPTRTFCNPFVSNWGLGRSFLNHLTHLAYWHGSWAIFRNDLNRMRRESLNLPDLPIRKPSSGMHRHARMILYGYSPAVLPVPSDWTDSTHVSGYWFLKPVDDWTPPRELEDFLDAGPPPVCIGFGSMTDGDADFLTAIAIETLRRNNLRGILLTGWGALTNTKFPDTIMKLESAPHDWLFSRTAAVVHHGGAGTTAAGLRAGVPTVIIPFFADQFFWGSVVHGLGAGTRPIPRRRLTAVGLTRAVGQAVFDKSIRRRSEAIAQCIAREDGVASAVGFVRRVVSKEGACRH